MVTRPENHPARFSIGPLPIAVTMALLQLLAGGFVPARLPLGQSQKRYSGHLFSMGMARQGSRLFRSICRQGQAVQEILLAFFKLLGKIFQLERNLW